MVIKLTRDVQVGRMGEVIDLPYQRAIYLIRMGAALEWKQTAEVTDIEEDKPMVVKKKKTAGKTSGRAAGKTAGKTAKKTAKK
jgi:hypothetical protein